MSTTPELRDDVEAELHEEWPHTLDVSDVAGRVGEETESVQLALLDLHRRGKVSLTADWNWRTVGGPPTEAVEQ